MRHLRFRATIASLVVVALSTAGLVIAPAAVAQEGKSVTLQALCTRGAQDGTLVGCTSEFTVTLGGGGEGFRVSFSEDEVGGTGDQWHAAGWNAATTATLLLGEPLSGQKAEFEITGEIDGPSAGALMTVGVLALLRGDKVDKKVTMTGTINPDGTVGPVGGIPLKVDGAVEAEKTTMLIPDGQRNSIDPNTGELVDVVDVGQDAGVTVQEVADVYEAYEAFTGEQLPRLTGNDTDLSPEAYNKLEALTRSWTAEFNASDAEFGAIDPTIQSIPLVTNFAVAASDAGIRSDQLSQEGVQAGAYIKGVEAAALANATVKAGQALQIYFTQGIDPFISQIEASASIEEKASAFFDGLENFKPKTLSEAAGLIGAYGDAIDALALADQASAQFDIANQGTTEDEVLTAAILGAMFLEISGTSIDAAKELQDFSSDLEGPPVKATKDLDSVADFFRKAAQANMDAFDSLIVSRLATENGVSEDIVREALSQSDFEYTLALRGSQTIGDTIDEFINNETAAAYANLGGATALYAALGHAAGEVLLAQRAGRRHRRRGRRPARVGPRRTRSTPLRPRPPARSRRCVRRRPTRRWLRARSRSRASRVKATPPRSSTRSRTCSARTSSHACSRTSVRSRRRASSSESRDTSCDGRPSGAARFASAGDGSAEVGPAARRRIVPERLRGLGLAEQVALRELATERAELGELLRRLDSLGDRAQAERVGEAHDRGADRGVLGLAPEPVDERPVDLQRLDREPLQVRHRRVAGAEVVDAEVHAERGATRRAWRPWTRRHASGCSP